MTSMDVRRIAAAAAFLTLFSGVTAAASADAAGESRRMLRAKELIADEQWSRAIDVLRAAAVDPKEPNKDEALFWLAHSQNQENDFAGAVDSIRRLEREHASSRWAKPARSLLIELAQKLRRDDVLWWTAVPPATPAPVPSVATTTPRPAPAPRSGQRPAPMPSRAGRTPPPHPVADAAVVATTPVPAAPPAAWVSGTWRFDSDQRILALGRLIHTDSAKVIPMLRHIALEKNDPGAARRAMFVLAQSRKPEAQSVVVEVAKRGPEPVRVAAVRELGRFGGPEVPQTLLEVYSTANFPVKRQVVTSLGERAEASALFRIAQSEGDFTLRTTAIVTLGRAGGREQLLLLYAKADRASKGPIIMGLVSARGEDELIRIADTEADEQLRAEVLARLRLLGTPKARAYIAKIAKGNR